MLELTINEVVYQFNFGMGFMREINRRICAPIDGMPSVKKNIGLRYMVSGIVDGDLEALVDILEAANKGQNPRLTRQALDAYIDDEATDIDALFDQVTDFLKRANATRRITNEILEVVEKQKAEMEKK